MRQKLFQTLASQILNAKRECLLNDFHSYNVQRFYYDSENLSFFDHNLRSSTNFHKKSHFLRNAKAKIVLRYIIILWKSVERVEYRKLF